MDRRRRRFSPSVSRSPRRRSPERGRRRHSRSFSRSSSRSFAGHKSQSFRGSKGGTRERYEDRYVHKRSDSRERYQHRETKKERRIISSGRSNSRRSRRSRSRSVDARVTSRSRDFSHRRSPSPQRHSSNVRQSPSSRRRSSSSHARRRFTRSRSTTPRRRSPTPRRRSPGQQRRRSIPRHHSPSPRRRSSSTRHRSPSSHQYSLRQRSPSSHQHNLRQRSPSSRRHSQHQRSPSPRYRSASVRRRSHSPCHDRRSRSRSNSRRFRSQDAASRSSSSRGRSSCRNMDRRSADPPAPKQSLIALPSSSAGTSPKATSADSTDGKQHRKESTQGDRVSDENRSFFAESHDYKGSNIHGASHGFDHHHVHNRRPFQEDACAPSFSTATQGPPAPVKSITVSDRVTTSSPRGGHSSAPTPTRSTGADGNHHTFSPVVNPIVEKKRQAQRESHRTYLKSNSDYNRAEMKYVSIEAELRLAEFWLDVMTKNLEDVGKRIEVHDWEFQKITGQGDSNVSSC